jgi:hypothetical protein
MSESSDRGVFLRILKTHEKGITTEEEAVGQLIYAVTDPSEVNDLLGLLNPSLLNVLRRQIDVYPDTDDDWQRKPFLVLDGDDSHRERYRARVRATVEALRHHFEGA